MKKDDNFNDPLVKVLNVASIIGLAMFVISIFIGIAKSSSEPEYDFSHLYDYKYKSSYKSNYGSAESHTESTGQTSPRYSPKNYGSKSNGKNDDDQYNTKDYRNADDFYYDHYDDFFDYYDAENYYNKFN